VRKFVLKIGTGQLTGEKSEVHVTNTIETFKELFKDDGQHNSNVKVFGIGVQNSNDFIVEEIA
jgi:hypothetical protein